MAFDIKNIRNFSIIAHIDHGKSTLSDRIIEYCGGLESREMQAQVLDSMDIERERGITIKSQTVRLNYTLNGTDYVLNLMDTPGHVDFSYEVSRCLAACEGAILLVDATQGVEAQTLANAYKALDANNEIIPVLNKADLPSIDIPNTKKQIEEVIGLPAQDAILASAKTGLGIPEILASIIKNIPAPVGSSTKVPKALLVDAWYDIYLGVIMLVRIIDGSFKKGDKIKMMSNDAVHAIEKIGIFTPKKVDADELTAGEVGFICANIKHAKDCNIGDTIISEKDETTEALPGFKKIQPVVFCGMYPTETNDYQTLKDSLGKLQLNDSSLFYEYETSAALGFGFRCGFLGLLHMEVVQERLEREFDLDIVTTAPSVVYKMLMRDGSEMLVHNPAEYPDPMLIQSIEEPIAKVSIIMPENYVGDIIALCVEKRGTQKEMNFSTSGRVMLVYHIPMAEIIFDFHDKVKSISRGYASFEWEICGYEKSDVVKVSVLLNGEAVDALSLLTHRGKAETRGRSLCLKLKESIDRQMFVVPIQAAIGGKIIARETIPAMRKDVTAKCYGGDISRKRKLLDKQKKGKKKMRMLGSVEVPQKAFLAILKIED
jgi:GTP-binding protein LepA